MGIWAGCQLWDNSISVHKDIQRYRHGLSLSNQLWDSVVEGFRELRNADSLLHEALQVGELVVGANHGFDQFVHCRNRVPNVTTKTTERQSGIPAILKSASVLSLIVGIVLGSSTAAQGQTLEGGSVTCPSPRTVHTFSYSHAGDVAHYQLHQGVLWYKTFTNLSYTYRSYAKGFASITSWKIESPKYVDPGGATCIT